MNIKLRKEAEKIIMKKTEIVIVFIPGSRFDERSRGSTKWAQ